MVGCVSLDRADLECLGCCCASIPSLIILNDRRVYMYSCSTSREPGVLITDAKLDALPVRRADGATVVDREKHYVKLNCNEEEGGVRNVRVRRDRPENEGPAPGPGARDGACEAARLGDSQQQFIERHRRFVTSAYGIPVAYLDHKSERFLYIIKGALVMTDTA